jgi:hypothetical protein
MEVPEHSIPQTWMSPTKVMSSYHTWVFTALRWGKGHFFFLDPLNFHYKRTGLPYKRRQTLRGDMASLPEDLILDSFIIAGASNRCDKNASGFKQHLSTIPNFSPEWHVQDRSLLPPVVIPLCEPVRYLSQGNYRVKVSTLPFMLHRG